MASNTGNGKRPLSGASGPPAKKPFTEAVQMGPIATLEEMDIKVLKFQNKKLSERLDQRHRAEWELKQRIEQLEKRQMSDDAVLNIVNRYWNQLNEDIRVLLQRFDSETTDELESKNECEATTAFLTQLCSWDKEEMEERLEQRVQVTKRAVAKILQAFDRLLQRNHKINLALKGELCEDEPAPDLEKTVKEAYSKLESENRNLHSMITALHHSHHTMGLKVAEAQEKATAFETKNAELRNRIEDLEYELSKTKNREEKLDKNFCEALEKLKNYSTSNADGDKKIESIQHVNAVSQRKLDEMQRELEEQKELSHNRLSELEKLQESHKDTLKIVEKLKMDIRQLPESVIVETTEYKCLQSQFSVLYNDSMQLKTQLEETRNVLNNSKNTHLRQTEQMESEELVTQKKLRNELIQLEDNLSQVRKEYEMLRIEFEQNLAANEQTGPINREMRHLITSLQNHNLQLKGEVCRYKRKFKETNVELQRLRSTEDKTVTSVAAIVTSVVGGNYHAVKTEVKTEPTANTSSVQDKESGQTCKDEEKPNLTEIKEEVIKTEKEEGEQESNCDKDIAKEKIKLECGESIRDLKAQLKKSQEAQKELKLLLDMYKGVAKEQRDKAQLMASEKKARCEIEDLKQQLKKLFENEKKERRKLADEDALRKIKMLEDAVIQLQKSVTAQKQEEDTLLNEMEVTGQAFEDMQEQNVRLIQQLREKDDANFKLMSERIKSNQIQKLLREEKDVLADQVITLNNQVEAQNLVVRKLEEKERILQNNLSTVEKELSLRQQAMEMHKRKAIESAQSAADLKLHLEKYHAQLKEAQIVVADKTSTLEQESFKTRRLQEENAGLRKKAERAKKIELASTADVVLLEEIKEYKEQLTCPSCKNKRKDAVLTKCFHVFCFDCLKTRYETRQRKCPKCNAAFGANDFHRLYLS
ncbi:E3 ubiquitin-protein ligase Bre1 [Nymphon striatum]|nr:E3 ubiquitin-protein ligase Bre1 [Nymphon striatum]